VFKQVFSGKTSNVVAYPVARHASIINNMLPSQKKMKMTNLQNSITSSMLVRQSDPKTINHPQKIIS